MAGSHLRTGEATGAPRPAGPSAPSRSGTAAWPVVPSGSTAGSRIALAPLVVAIALTLVRLWVCLQTPVLPSMAAVHDEGLFVDEAWNVLQGDWLGTDPAFVMVKSPGFALFLALVGLSALPYQLWMAAVTIVAAALSARSLRPVVPSDGIRCAVYVWMLFCPQLFSLHAFMYVYRNLLSAELVVIILSSYLGLWLRRRSFDARWLIPASLALGLFWILNESQAWIVPFVACASAIIGVTAWRSGGLRVLWLLAPVAAAALAWGAVSLANLQAYGVFANNVRYEGAEGDVLSDLVAIDGVDGSGGDDKVWVSRAEVERALEASPTFATIEDEVTRYLDQWGGGPGGEIPGDIYGWALNDAAASAWPTPSLAEREAFWAQVHGELQAAFESGELQRTEGLRLAASVPAIPWDGLPGWVGRGFSALLWVFDGEDLTRALIDFDDYDFATLSGTPAAQRIARYVLGGPMIFWSEEDGPGPVSVEGEFAMGVDRAFVSAWRLAMPFLSILGLVCLVLVIVRAARGSAPMRESLLPLAALALCMVELSLAVSWFCSFLGNWELFNYLMPVLAMAGLWLAWLYALALQWLVDARPKAQ